MLTTDISNYPKILLFVKFPSTVFSVIVMPETPFPNTINQPEQKSIEVLSTKTDEKLFEYI